MIGYFTQADPEYGRLVTEGLKKHEKMNMSMKKEELAGAK